MRTVPLAALALCACSADTFTPPFDLLKPDVGADINIGPDASDPPPDGGVVDGALDVATVDASDAGSFSDVGSDAPTTTSKRVFHTSGSFEPDWGGHAGADAICHTAATAAGLSGTFYAWVSTSTESASAHLSHATVPYKLLDGTLVAADWPSLIAAGPVHEILIDENGKAASGAVYTGTDMTGATLSGETCSDWTDKTSASHGELGCVTTPYSWTACSSDPCGGGPTGLYCFEQ